MTEKFSKFGKIINLQTEESKIIPSMKHPKKSMPRHFKIKLLIIKRQNKS